MTDSIPAEHRLPTHDVANQPAVAGDRDLWAPDVALREAVALGGGDPAVLAVPTSPRPRVPRTACFPNCASSTAAGGGWTR